MFYFLYEVVCNPCLRTGMMNYNSAIDVCGRSEERRVGKECLE